MMYQFGARFRAQKTEKSRGRSKSDCLASRHDG